MIEVHRLKYNLLIYVYQPNCLWRKKKEQEFEKTISEATSGIIKKSFITFSPLLQDENICYIAKKNSTVLFALNDFMISKNNSLSSCVDMKVLKTVFALNEVSCIKRQKVFFHCRSS